jgi:hypothetical protein
MCLANWLSNDEIYSADNSAITGPLVLLGPLSLIVYAVLLVSMRPSWRALKQLVNS